MKYKITAEIEVDSKWSQREIREGVEFQLGFRWEVGNDNPIHNEDFECLAVEVKAADLCI